MMCSWRELILLCTVFVLVDGKCTDGSDCPEWLPYCTSVGCVFSCPDNVFINGTTCVQDCGNKFIFNKTCFSECPATHAYIKKEIVADMSAFHALNFCLQKCPVNMFVYDHQCVEVCPKDAPYVFKSKCISQCPTTDVYQRKLFKNERVVAVECLSDCAEYSFLKHGNQCIETCSSSLFQFEGECVDICPDNVSFIYSTSYNGKLTRECKQACPHWTYYFNGTCVDSCPPNYLIYNNSLCVEKCPNDAFYTSSYHRNSFYDERRFDCVADCHPYYIFNDSCLLTCPEETVLVNTTCSQSCPNSAPYMCDETKEVLCRENRESNSWFGGIYRYNTPRQMNYVKRCSIKCPEKMLVDGFRCINQCSDSKKFFNNSCLNDCPKEFPYIKGRNECVSECPAKSYVENSVCVEHCSGDLFAVEDHRMCMSSCPLSKYVIKEKFCLIQCPSPLFNDSGTCAGSCISKFAINNTCVQKCPESHPLYLSAEPWNYHPGTWKCVSECPEHWFTFNGTCIQRCQQKIGPNRTCVSECPASHPFSKKTGYSDVEWHCLISCPDNWLSNNGICVRDCPQKLYLNKTCISKCPVSHPYFSEELRTYSQQSCADKCGFDECLLNKTCIKLTSLENAVIFHGKCLQECPGGYVWLYVSTHLTEGSEAACTSVIFLSLILIGFVFLSVFWMFCCWRFSSTSDSGSRVLKYVFLEPCDRQSGPKNDEIGIDFNIEDNTVPLDDKLLECNIEEGDGGEELPLLEQTSTEVEESETDSSTNVQAQVHFSCENEGFEE